MARQARLDSPGKLHHVMVRGIEGAEIVRGVKDCKEFVKRMGRVASETVACAGSAGRLSMVWTWLHLGV